MESNIHGKIVLTNHKGDFPQLRLELRLLYSVMGEDMTNVNAGGCSTQAYFRHSPQRYFENLRRNEHIFHVISRILVT